MFKVFLAIHTKPIKSHVNVHPLDNCSVVKFHKIKVNLKEVKMARKNKENKVY